MLDELKKRVKKAAPHQRVHDRTAAALEKAHGKKQPKKRTVQGSTSSVDYYE